MEHPASEREITTQNAKAMAVASNQPQFPSVVSDISFSQMDRLEQAKLFYSMSNSLGELKLDTVDRKRPLLRVILRRSFSQSFALIVSFWLIFGMGTIGTVEIILHRPFLRHISVAFLLTASVISLVLSVAAGVAYTVLGYELSFKLRRIEQHLGSPDTVDANKPAE